MSGYTCYKCGHPLNETMFGGLQNCPNCRTVDAINKQTELLKKQQIQGTDYSSPSNNSGSLLKFSFYILVIYGVWVFLEWLWDIITTHPWWSALFLIVMFIIAYLIGNSTEE